MQIAIIICFGLLPALALAQAVPPAMPAPTTNLPPPQAAPTTNLPTPVAAPNPLVVPTAPMYLTASQTFISRGSTATYFDNTGTLQTAPVNTPRYDYDPITHVAKGILVEPRRTNMLDSSSPNTGWTKSRVAVLESSAIGPDGVSLMTQITATAADHVALRQKANIQPNKNYVISVFYKRGTTTYIKLELSDTVSQGYGIFIDTVSQSLTQAKSGTGELLDYGVVDVGNGIYRVWVEIKYPSILRQQYLSIGLVDTKETGQPVAVGGYVYLWGAQVEQADSLSSYIPTNGTPATRAQDVYQQFNQ